MTDLFKDCSHSVLLEFVHFMTGKFIGGGMSRQVFEHPTDHTKVIKLEDSQKHFQNVLEWELWNEVKDTPEISRWLAPCHAISYSGTFLIMSRAEDLAQGEKPLLPAFLTDHKIENFGRIKGKIVCRDYGMTLKNISTRMRKWRGS